MALAEASVALGAAVAWGLASTSLLLLLLLLLCSFFHRANRRFSTQKMEEPPALVRGVRLARLGSGNGGAALLGGIPSPGEPQQQADSLVVPGDPDNAGAGHPRLQVPGWTPHSQELSGPSPRTPEFLRHRQLPVLPGDAGTPAADTALDAEGTIYESIRYKAGMLKKPWDAGSTPRDSPSLPTRDKPSIPVQEVIIQEEPGSEGTPSPVYARVCKLHRAPQPQQPPSHPEPQEEAPPLLPEKHFDVA
ncbi:uncharacterized protein LOC142054220 [Phalacrocorax aristotelis]|uniref:uncharacterized protein LOC142054220 n=1 Tax=Phalacrocorax aristotelis TaxID=126867 RepID=UPI003F4C60B8